MLRDEGTEGSENEVNRQKGSESWVSCGVLVDKKKTRRTKSRLSFSRQGKRKRAHPCHSFIHSFIRISFSSIHPFIPPLSLLSFSLLLLSPPTQDRFLHTTHTPKETSRPSHLPRATLCCHRLGTPSPSWNPPSLFLHLCFLPLSLPFLSILSTLLVLSTPHGQSLSYFLLFADIYPRCGSHPF